jgi:hypothetical protein
MRARLRMRASIHGDDTIPRAAGLRAATAGVALAVIAGGVDQWQEVRGGGSYLSQNDLRVHFGLGAAAIVDRLDVLWPNGGEEHWTHLAADKVHTIVEGIMGGRDSIRR